MCEPNREVDAVVRPHLWVRQRGHQRDQRRIIRDRRVWDRGHAARLAAARIVRCLLDDQVTQMDQPLPPSDLGLLEWQSAPEDRSVRFEFEAHCEKRQFADVLTLNRARHRIAKAELNIERSVDRDALVAAMAAAASQDQG
jgi:hypothetical protein